MNLHFIRAATLFCVLAMAGSGISAADAPRPTRKDKCPVCGMFVYKYPDWTAAIVFRDDVRVFFDGAKDLFKYYLNFPKYNPSRTPADVARIYVTEYYRMEPIDARKAYFVAGSDVYGPMGHELIALATEADARQFMKDHRGRRILGFSQITLRVIQALD